MSYNTMYIISIAFALIGAQVYADADYNQLVEKVGHYTFAAECVVEKNKDAKNEWQTYKYKVIKLYWGSYKKVEPGMYVSKKLYQLTQEFDKCWVFIADRGVDTKKRPRVLIVRSSENIVKSKYLEFAEGISRKKLGFLLKKLGEEKVKRP